MDFGICVADEARARTLTARDEEERKFLLAVESAMKMSLSWLDLDSHALDESFHKEHASVSEVHVAVQRRLKGLQ